MQIFGRWLLLLTLAFDLAGSPFHAHSHDLGLHHVGGHQHASQSDGALGGDLDDGDEAFGHSLAAIRCVHETGVAAAGQAQPVVPLGPAPLAIAAAPEAAPWSSLPGRIPIPDPPHLRPGGRAPPPLRA